MKQDNSYIIPMTVPKDNWTDEVIDRYSTMSTEEMIRLQRQVNSSIIHLDLALGISKKTEQSNYCEGSMWKRDQERSLNG